MTDLAQQHWQSEERILFSCTREFQQIILGQLCINPIIKFYSFNIYILNKWLIASQQYSDPIIQGKIPPNSIVATSGYWYQKMRNVLERMQKHFTDFFTYFSFNGILSLRDFRQKILTRN